jgi:SH3-like domain-containing protein
MEPRIKSGLKEFPSINFFAVGLFLVVLIFCYPQTSLADLGRETGLEVPRFVSLSSNKTNVRAGPGRRYPLKWIYQRQNLPVKVIAEFDTWRKIKDHEDIEGWVHQRMLSGRKWVFVIRENTIIRDGQRATARDVARLEPGVIARLGECSVEWCLVEADSYKGWILKTDVWGAITK